MKDLGVADVILNIKLLKDDDGGITLLQSHYVEKILSRFGYSDCKSSPTPYDPSVIIRFGERSGATTGSTTSSSDDEFLHTDNFFPDLSDFFDNLNMGDNDAAAKCDMFIYLTSLHD
ncbi:hypothetical protein QYE76_042567 [Lolium multiflorum]|uniref:Reverse transcriptase Ty1/copia-type domain-containing protein n=1 Tax=Lolium multiflorum TaxID=4521 RepID=A0AAD8TH76_LOLMU|nr:hypothetical protein QYE76_042567 [Lolium multiflorum]